MSSELTIYEKINDPIAAVTQLGEMFTRSGMFGCQKIEQGQVLALACISEKKSPFELMKTYHIIEGKLEMKSGAMLARFLEMGGKCIWRSNLQGTEEAAAYFEFGENKGEFIYSMEDAKREGLKDRAVWKKSAPDMLRARLVSKVVRMFAPQINAGIYCEEEMTGSEVIEKELRLEPEPEPEMKPAKAAGGKRAEPDPDPVEVTVIVEDNPFGDAEVEPEAEKPKVEVPLITRAADVIAGIGEERVLHFLRTRGKLAPDGKIGDLPEEYLKNIVAMPSVFERSIEAAEKAEKGKGDEA